MSGDRQAYCSERCSERRARLHKGKCCVNLSLPCVASGNSRLQDSDKKILTLFYKLVVHETLPFKIA